MSRTIEELRTFVERVNHRHDMSLKLDGRQLPNGEVEYVVRHKRWRTEWADPHTVYEQARCYFFGWTDSREALGYRA